jgi:hypothetical protein
VDEDQQHYLHNSIFKNELFVSAFWQHDGGVA